MLNDVRLRVVPIESVRPHEVVDPLREQRIERRIREDGVLRDPLLVGEVPDVEGYVLLDGTNRLSALRAIGVAGALVQIIEYADPRAIQLRTWCHAAPLPFDDIAARARGIHDVEIVPLPPLAGPDTLGARDTLALLLQGRNHCVLRRTDERADNRADQLRRLVDIYEDRMVRVDCDPDAIEDFGHHAEGPSGEAATLIAFPPVTRAQVVEMAMKGRLIPAGITRHVIVRGRALRVNLSLEVLWARNGIAAADDSLHRHLAGLHPRVYGEPTVLYDS